MENFDDVKPFDVKKDLVDNPGKQLTQTRTSYQVAVSVPKPRDIDKIIAAIKEEAVSAKDDFYWGWQVNNNKTGKKDWIEGGTIGCAQALIRNWTNCAIETDIRTEGIEWVFKTTFIDFENGFTTQREYRMLIPKEAKGNYDYERARNIKFQVGQSKNQRDTIFNALPRWLKNLAIEEAKKASKAEVKKNPDDKFKKAMDFCEEKGLTQQEIYTYFGKEKSTEFTVTDISRLRNIANQLYNGEIKPEDIRKQIQEDFEKEIRK